MHQCEPVHRNEAAAKLHSGSKATVDHAKKEEKKGEEKAHKQAAKVGT